MNSKDSTYSIILDHVTRIEGHGSVRVSVRDGRVEELTLAIVEAQRFFESFTRGMLAHEIPWIVGRICGICCVAHQMAASKAVEAALGLEVSRQSRLLRRAAQRVADPAEPPAPCLFPRRAGLCRRSQRSAPGQDPSRCGQAGAAPQASGQ